MSKRWDICAPEKSKDGGKTYWTKIGVMFERDKGGFVIHMAYPQAELYAFEPQERDQERGSSTARPAPAAAPKQTQRRDADDEQPERRPEDEPGTSFTDDEIPF